MNKRRSSEQEQEIRTFVMERQAKKHTKYEVARAAEFKFVMTWQEAYYRVRKYWTPPTYGKK